MPNVMLNPKYTTPGKSGTRSESRQPTGKVAVNLPLDVVEELEARHDDRLTRFLELHPDASHEAARISVRQAHEQYVVTRRAPCYDPEYKGPCLDPTHCVARDGEGRLHADKRRWAGYEYIYDWIIMLAARIRSDNPRLLDRLKWQRITLTTGPGPDDDQSPEGMVAAASLFSRRNGYRWDEFFCRRDPRSPNDNRLITATARQFLLEARIRLSPGQSPAVTPRRGEGVRTSTPNASTVAWSGGGDGETVGLRPWSVAFDFLYYGSELDETTIARLTRRWKLHPRNRGRSSVDCDVVPVRKEGGALHGLQGYRLGCLRLPGTDRVHLDRARAEHRLHRIFRRGAGQGKLKLAKRVWAETLAAATRDAYHLPVQADWAQKLAEFDDTTAWPDAMGQLESDERTLAHNWRWGRRRTLYRERLFEMGLAVSLKPSLFIHDDSNIDGPAMAVAESKNEGGSPVTADQMRQIMREELQTALQPLIEAVRDGRMSPDEFEKQSRLVLKSKKVQ